LFAFSLKKKAVLDYSPFLTIVDNWQAGIILAFREAIFYGSLIRLEKKANEFGGKRGFPLHSLAKIRVTIVAPSLRIDYYSRP